MKDAGLGSRATNMSQGPHTMQASMLARGVEHFGGMVTSAIDETEQGQLPWQAKTQSSRRRGGPPERVPVAEGAVQDTESKQSTEHKAHSTEPM